MPTYRDDIHRGTAVPLVKTDDLDDLSITTDKLADGSVTEPKLAKDSVSTEKIRDGAVETDKLADGAVTNPKLHDDSVSTGKIIDQNVTTAKIKDKNVTTEKVKDSAITTPKLADENVTAEKLSSDSVLTEKIKDHNVTWDKLNEEVQEVVQAGTGVDGKLINDMQEWNERIAALESAKMTPTVKITAADVTEYDGGATVPLKVELVAEKNIDSDENFTDRAMTLTIGGVSNTLSKGTYSEDYAFIKPSSLTIKASGTAKYKGVATTFPEASKTIYAVLPSYIGYVGSTDNWNMTGEKLVKHSLSGSYNVTNGYSDAAYLVVAVPVDGAVNAVNKIVQHGTLDAEQQFDKVTKNGYTLYVCKTKHNPGTYNFILS